jgi:GT2 family glycosyltransferase
MNQPQDTGQSLLPDLSLIIISWNTRELLAQCLQSVHEELALFPSLVCETFVVDNASHDGSATLLRESFSWVKLVQNPDNIGFARANNQAIHMSCGRYVLLLNPDTRVMPGALQTIVQFMDSHPEAGAAGSRLLNPDGTLQPSCHPAPTLSRELWRLFHLDLFYPYAIYRMQDWPIILPRLVDVVQGASMILRRDVLGLVGDLDTDYFIYSEEVDLCYRIQQSGWSIYWMPQSAVVHYGGQSTQQVAAEMFLRLYQGKILYFRKHRGQLAAYIYKLILLAAATTRLVLSPLGWLIASPQQSQRQQLADHYRRLVVALPRL